MTTREHEQTLNVWLAGLLRERGVNARQEVTHPGLGRIDVEVRIGPAILAVEAEHGQSTAKQAEAVRDADRRLEQGLVDAAIAVCYPDDTDEQFPARRSIPLGGARPGRNSAPLDGPATWSSWFRSSG